VLNPDFAGPQFNQIQIIRALGQPLIMVTISLIATAYILPQDAGSASSLFNILRNLGGAIGIALLATLLDARTKTYFDYLREAMVPSNPQVAERLASMTDPWAMKRRRWASSARLPISRRRSWPTTMRFTLSGSRWGQHAGGVVDQEVASGA
jgi:hypothetical protein